METGDSSVQVICTGIQWNYNWSSQSQHKQY